MSKFSTNEDLFEALKAENSEAQRELYEKIYPKLCQCSFKIVKDSEEARDIAINRFQKCLAKVKDMENYDHLVGALITATKNFSLNYVRDRSKWNKLSMDTVRLDEVPDNATIIEMNESEVEAFIRKELALENPINQQVGELAFVEGISNQEIMKLTGLDERSVRNRKTRILDRLRKAFINAGLRILF